MSIILVTGGARSGKSIYAETRALALPGRPTYIATSEILDEEMAARVAEHRARRGGRWHERHAPLDLALALEETDGLGPRLVDCLTLWLSNLMFAERDIAGESTALATAIKAQTSPVVFVTNEVGMGIVPENALARRFRDAAGRLNQTVAILADEVELLVAGYPVKVK